MNLVEFFDEIIVIEGDFRICVGMMNLNYVIKFFDELIEFIKILRFISFFICLFRVVIMKF